MFTGQMQGNLKMIVKIPSTVLLGASQGSNKHRVGSKICPSCVATFNFDALYRKADESIRTKLS